MFKPAALRVAALLAMILSVLGLLLSLVLARQSGTLALGAVSWALLLWASFLGFKLAGYKLYAEEYKKVGFRIYLIIAAFGLFLFVGVVVGLALAVALLGALWGLKRNYDEWQPSAEPAEAGEV
ncbi:MAG: hypothetical protein EOO62_12370 [Hymenobacter sp.]|nr:MAG: hypothetical protein EOO62_12370 [Hymenobacter sp.]